MWDTDLCGDTELCPQTPKIFCIFGNDRGVQFVSTGFWCKFFFIFCFL